MIPPYLTIDKMATANVQSMILGVMPCLPRNAEGRYVAGSLARVASTSNASALFFACAAASGLWDDGPRRAACDPIVAAAMAAEKAARLAFRWAR